MAEAQQDITTIEPVEEDGGRDLQVSTSSELTPMGMLDRAVQGGASIEVLEKLMALQERWEGNSARKAFDAAIADAKAEIPVIQKKQHVHFESKKQGSATTDYHHESLADIAEVVAPILGKHGLSYRFRTMSPPNEPVTVTCIISHRDGHSEENTLSAGKDESGNKNSIQAVGSTITYLQRYTLKAALGLAAGHDDDGNGSEPPEMLSEEQIMNLHELLESTESDVAKFLAFVEVERLEEIHASKYEQAVKVIEQAAAKRKAKAAS